MKKSLFTLFALLLFTLTVYCQQAETNLSGTWNVTVNQVSDEKDKRIVYDMKVNIKQVGNLVIGEFNFKLKEIPINFDKELKTQANFKTPFQGEINQGHLHFTYNNPDPEIDQFGSAMLKIDSDSRMEGLFLGFGPETQTIVQGTLVFKKE